MNTQNRLSLIFNIEPGESRLVLLLLLYSFFAGSARLLVSTAASTLFRDRFGEPAAQLLPYVYIGAAIAAPLTGFLYSKLEERFSFARLLAANLGFLLVATASLYAFLLWLPQAKWPAMALYIWYYVLYALISLSFWGLAGRLFDIRQSKRLFGLIGSGLVVAMALSGFAVRPLVSLIGTSNLLLVAVAGVAVCLVLMLYITRIFHPDSPVAKTQDEPKQDRPDLIDLIQNRYIALMIGLTVLNLLAYYFIDNAFYDRAYLRYPDKNELAGFLGEFLAVSSLLSLASRAFISGKLVNKYGLLVGLLTLPLALALSVMLLAGVGTVFGAIPFIFWLVVFTRLLFRVLEDSINRPAFSVLFQSLPGGTRLRAQTLIISVIEPVAGGLAGVVLLLLSFNAIQLSYVLLFVLAGWITGAVLASREYRTVLLQTLSKNKLGEVSLAVVDDASLGVLKQALKSPYPGVVIYALETLETLQHELLPHFLREALSHSDPEVRQDALRRIERLGLTSLWRSVNLRVRFEASIPVRAAALRTLAALSQADQLDEIAPYLDEPEPQMRRGAMVGLLRSGGIEGVLMAGEKLIHQVDSPQPTDREFAARVLGEVGIASFYRPLLKLLRDDELQVRHTALAAAGKLKHPKLWPLVIANLGQPEVRTVATSTLIVGGEAALPDIRSAFAQKNQPVEILTRLARICGRIRGPEAVALLLEQMDAPDNNLRYQTLLSLSRCDYHAPADQAGVIQQKIKAEIDNAAWTLAALVDLEPASTHGPNEEILGLLQKALLNGLNQSKARVFLLLSFIYQAEVILRARDNLNHPSKETRAYALEVLDNTLTSQKLKAPTLTGQEFRALFFPLVDENLTPDQRLERLSEAFPQSRLDPRQRLAEIMTRSNEWISSWTKLCAQETLGRWPVTAENAPAKNGEMIMLSTIEKVIILKSVHIFAETPEEALAEVVSTLKEVAVKAGEAIVKKGEVGRSMYIIISGRVRVHDGERTLAELGERDIFGELTVLDAEPRSATVTAIRDTRLFRLDQDVLYELMADHVEVARGIIQVLTRRLRRLSSQDEALQHDFTQELIVTTRKNILMGGILEKLSEES